ncbi:hypothetical protein K1719_030934 [Acacia pycnantha]|nr:hypothetical protein K1719_030934 [Acacia pycnantha]
MGDHFVLLVDRLITESTLEAALESRNRAMQEAAASAVNEAEEVIKTGTKDVKSPGKIVECRICHDEDENSNMETPCLCCGSLKYAHRRCIQRWCNEKGDTICEICHQQYKPGYTAPTSLFRFGRIPMTFRGNWEISRRELHNHGRLVHMVSTDDQYSDSSAGNLHCFRLNLICLMFMILFIFRHTLPLIISGNLDDSISLFLVLLFLAVVILPPIYLIVKAALTSIQRHRQRRQQQEPPNASINLSDDESQEQVALPSQLHVIRVQ